MANFETEHIRETFGANVRAGRRALGWTQTDLVDKLKELQGLSLTRDKVIRLEAGTRPTPLDEAAVIAKALDTPLSELLGESGDPTTYSLLEAQATYMESWNNIVNEVRAADSARKRMARDLESLESRLEDGDYPDPEHRKLAIQARDNARSALGQTIDNAVAIGRQRESVE